MEQPQIELLEQIECAVCYNNTHAGLAAKLCGCKVCDSCQLASFQEQSAQQNFLSKQEELRQAAKSKSKMSPLEQLSHVDSKSNECGIYRCAGCTSQLIIFSQLELHLQERAHSSSCVSASIKSECELHQKELDKLREMILKQELRAQKEDFVSCAHCARFNFLGTRGCTSAHVSCAYCAHSFNLPQEYMAHNTFWQMAQSFGAQIYKFIFTATCPGCGVPVQRASGCSHMTCAKCSARFCYYCSTFLNNHDFLGCAARFSPIPIAIIIAFLCFCNLLIPAIPIVNYISPIIGFIAWLLIAFINYLFVPQLLLTIAGLNIAYVAMFVCAARNMRTLRNEFKKFVSAAAVNYIAYTYVSWLQFDYAFLKQYYLTELLILACVGLAIGFITLVKCIRRRRKLRQVSYGYKRF